MSTIGIGVANDCHQWRAETSRKERTSSRSPQLGQRMKFKHFDRNSAKNYRTILTQVCRTGKLVRAKEREFPWFKLASPTLPPTNQQLTLQVVYLSCHHHLTLPLQDWCSAQASPPIRGISGPSTVDAVCLSTPEFTSNCISFRRKYPTWIVPSSQAQLPSRLDEEGRL